MRAFLMKAEAFVRSRAKLILLAGAGVAAGIFLTAGYATVTEITTSQQLCAHACHEMERTVYADYVKSRHHTNKSGTIVTCAECHLPQGDWPRRLGHQVTALSRVWGHYVDREYLPGRFEARRPELAKKVLQGFADTNARECKACHAYAVMILAEESATAQRDHATAMKTDANCLDCHKSLTHQRQDKPASYDFP
jgi:nitrate/TMAO reductase-like tetraheme cytochrome c subunit